MDDSAMPNGDVFTDETRIPFRDVKDRAILHVRIFTYGDGGLVTS
jgi:hypothetical protein